MKKRTWTIPLALLLILVVFSCSSSGNKRYMLRGKLITGSGKYVISDKSFRTKLLNVFTTKAYAAGETEVTEVWAIPCISTTTIDQQWLDQKQVCPIDSEGNFCVDMDAMAAKAPTVVLALVKDTSNITEKFQGVIGIESPQAALLQIPTETTTSDIEVGNVDKPIDNVALTEASTSDVAGAIGVDVSTLDAQALTDNVSKIVGNLIANDGSSWTYFIFQTWEQCFGESVNVLGPIDSQVTRVGLRLYYSKAANTLFDFAKLQDGSQWISFKAPADVLFMIRDMPIMNESRASEYYTLQGDESSWRYTLNDAYYISGLTRAINDGGFCAAFTIDTSSPGTTGMKPGYWTLNRNNVGMAPEVLTAVDISFAGVMNSIGRTIISPKVEITDEGGEFVLYLSFLKQDDNGVYSIPIDGNFFTVLNQQWFNRIKLEGSVVDGSPLEFEGDLKVVTRNSHSCYRLPASGFNYPGKAGADFRSLRITVANIAGSPVELTWFLGRYNPR